MCEFAGAVALYHIPYGDRGFPIWLDQVSCTGMESLLFQCYHNGFGNHDCSHSEDAGVRCPGNDVFSLVYTHAYHIRIYVY